MEILKSKCLADSSRQVIQMNHHFTESEIIMTSYEISVLKSDRLADSEYSSDDDPYMTTLNGQNNSS